MIFFFGAAVGFGCYRVLAGEHSINGLILMLLGVVGLMTL